MKAIKIIFLCIIVYFAIFLIKYRFQHPEVRETQLFPHLFDVLEDYNG